MELSFLRYFLCNSDFHIYAKILKFVLKRKFEGKDKPDFHQSNPKSRNCYTLIRFMDV